ncbi:fluoride efflux transporter CrcB [Pseudomonas sp. EA_105y_Pfl2_R69]|jgi:CrcB protein|uniref:fluoride efflux transporter CrcB n=1 Tax=Pseudomonas sp. EA_105y_Pfl2_R69 TaxID=3088683 RepID=UPI0030D7BD8E
MTRVLLAVAAGGAAGCVLRFLATSWVAASWPRHYYLATLTVNMLGCLLIGLLSGLFLLRSDLPLELRTGLTVGLLGGLTTFSSFSLELLGLLEGGRTAEAMGYLLCSMVGGLLAAWLGLTLARLCQ